MTTTTVPAAQIDYLIHDLGDHDGFVAQRARKKLEQLGAQAVPALINALRTGADRTRWQAAMALQNMYVPEAADALIEALNDDNQSVRWIACNALIKLRTAAYAPLLRALVLHPERTRLRSAAHHILHDIFMMPVVKKKLERVYEALDKNGTPVEVRIAAADALDAVEYHLK